MKHIGIAILAISFATGNVNAANLSFIGNFSNDDEVQPFNFSVEEPAADVTFRTWSYAGGTNASGAEIARGGFDPVITLFDARGIKISQNDDGQLVTDPVTGQGFDSFLMANLSAGNYTAILTQFGSFSTGTLIDGFLGTTTINFGNRASLWALDALNVSSASAGVPYISAVPEPETYAMLLAGLGLLGWRLRPA